MAAPCGARRQPLLLLLLGEEQGRTGGPRGEGDYKGLEGCAVGLGGVWGTGVFGMGGCGTVSSGGGATTRDPGAAGLARGRGASELFLHRPVSGVDSPGRCLGCQFQLPKGSLESRSQPRA